MVRDKSGRGELVLETSSWSTVGETWGADMDTGSVLMFCLPIMVSMENLEMSPFGFETKFVC